MNYFINNLACKKNKRIKDTSQNCFDIEIMSHKVVLACR